MLLLLLGLLLRTTAASDTRNVLYEYVSEWVLDANISVAAAPRTDICKCFNENLDIWKVYPHNEIYFSPSKV